MIFIPAANYFSVDAYKGRLKASTLVPRWNIDGVKVLLPRVGGCVPNARTAQWNGSDLWT